MYESLNLRIPHPSTNVKDISKFDELPQFGELIIFFITPWDQACQQLSNGYDKQSKLDIYKEFTFYKVNADVNYELFNIFKIESIPTFISIKDGVEQYRINGGNTYKYLGKTYQHSKEFYIDYYTNFQTIYETFLMNQKLISI